MILWNWLAALVHGHDQRDVDTGLDSGSSLAFQQANPRGRTVSKDSCSYREPPQGERQLPCLKGERCSLLNAVCKCFCFPPRIPVASLLMRSTWSGNHDATAVHLSLEPRGSQRPALRSQRPRQDEQLLCSLCRRLFHGDQAYIAGLDVQLHEDAPLFRTRGAAPGPRGGRRHNPLPYQKSSLIDDFADIRRLVFGKDEKRRLMDMRRTGAVEAVSGGGTVESIAAKMGNSIDQNKTLQKTYMPVNLAAVRAADASRKIGRRAIASEQNEIKKLKLLGK